MAKQITHQTNTGQEKQEEQLAKQQERQELIFGADALLPASRFGDISLEKEYERITLISGKVISLKEIEDVIASRLQEYCVMFVPAYYKEIFRLNNWPWDPARRPHIVAVWTNEVIYARFKKDVLPTLQTLNPFTELGIRNYKHFQWLNEDGHKLLEGFILDAVRVMKTCSSWYEFRMKYGKEFNLPVQIRMWERN